MGLRNTQVFGHRSIVRSFACAAALGIATFSIAADTDSYSIDAHIIAAGNSPASNSCFRLRAVIGEPVAGFSSSADFTISAGFLSLAAPKSDDIFFNSFEECTP